MGNYNNNNNNNNNNIKQNSILTNCTKKLISSLYKKEQLNLTTASVLRDIYLNNLDNSIHNVNLKKHKIYYYVTFLPRKEHLIVKNYYICESKLYDQSIIFDVLENDSIYILYKLDNKHYDTFKDRIKFSQTNKGKLIIFRHVNDQNFYFVISVENIKDTIT